MAKKSNTDTRVSKEGEIAQLLREGTLPVELVRRGYARGTVYKVSGRLKKEGSILQTQTNQSAKDLLSKPDPTLQADPEIIELKKAVLKAELQKKLAQIGEQPDLLMRLVKLEVELDEAWDIIFDLQTKVYTRK